MQVSKINAITVKEKYPLPFRNDRLDQLESNCYFTMSNLASGNDQVSVARYMIERTAFITPEEHFEFLKMPFGLSNDPAAFHWLMEATLGSLKYSNNNPTKKYREIVVALNVYGMYLKNYEMDTLKNLAFLEIKNKLGTIPILVIFDSILPTELYTDALAIIGIVVVLL